MQVLGMVLAAIARHKPTITADDAPSTLGTIAAFALVATVYFVPLVVAVRRRSAYLTAVALINVLLGWTFIGWVVALLIALYGSKVDAGAAGPLTPLMVDPAQERMDAIAAGRFHAIVARGIVPLPNERFFYGQGAWHGQFYSQRVYTGTNPALYVPLGHGFRARVGGSRGTSAVQENFRWDAEGTVYFSNHRVVFKPNGQPSIVSIPYSTILAFEPYEDGLGLNVDKLGVQQFKTGDACIAALYSKIVETGHTPAILAEPDHAASSGPSNR